MIRNIACLAVAVIFALALLGKTAPPAGSWQVDSRHSDAQISTDGTTDFGKTKTTFTVGFARVGGIVKLDAANPANSAIHIDFYPSTSIDPTIDHDGKVRIEWFKNHANNTMVCFHSQGTEQTSDGRLSSRGPLGLIRVDRNVELTPNEAYAGPVYGAPMIHRVTREATFVFDFPDGATQKDGAILASGSAKVIGEDFPQLLKAVVATYWPPVVEDEHCTARGAGEAYSGSQCTGTFLQAPALPEPPRSSVGEDYPGGQPNFNAVVGNQLTILVHMRLKPSGSAAAGN